jgi:hypothetical protein
MENPDRTYTWRVIQDGRIWLLQLLPEHWVDAEPCDFCKAEAGEPCKDGCESYQSPTPPETVTDLEERDER